jgi:PhzF family phenazine biosynthesis protein
MVKSMHRKRSKDMKLPIYQVDAFTNQAFHGNPAAVMPLNFWPEDSLLQKIALENNLSETAFFVPQEDRFQIRWFTPSREVDLCGHATLASAFILFEILGYPLEKVVFESLSGSLEVQREMAQQGKKIFWMDFPSRPGQKVSKGKMDEVAMALGAEPIEVYQSRDIMAVFQEQKDVTQLRPDLRRIARLEGLGLIATAPGKDADFVSCFFAPGAGVDEDPVTGSAHTTLTPYWSKRLGKTRLTAQQISCRGGRLSCIKKGNRVLIGGGAVLVLQGEFLLPSPA